MPQPLAVMLKLKLAAMSVALSHSEPTDSRTAVHSFAANAMRKAFMAINEILSEAHSLWKKGNALEVGKLIFENLPVEARPQWAARVLRLVVDRTGVRSQPVELTISIAHTPNVWRKAHDIFSTLRKATVELERLSAPSPAQDLLLKHLLLAEVVAKVTYNSTSGMPKPGCV